MTSPGTPRFGIGLACSMRPARPLAWTDVPGGGQATAQVSFVPTARGLHEVPTLTAETRFPLGLFRAWTVWRPAARCWSIPRPRATRRRCRRRPGRSPAAPTRSRHSESGEIEGVRAYRRGDPLKLVAWKKAAQALRPVANWSAATPACRRARSSGSTGRACGAAGARGAPVAPGRLGAAAERPAPDYGLRLPGLEIAPAGGEAHARRCLEALALWQRMSSAALRRSLPARAGPAGSACRATRATRCSCSAVIAWTVLPHVPHLPAWCIALTAPVLLWRGQLAVTAGRCRAAGSLVARADGRHRPDLWTLPHACSARSRASRWRSC